MIIHNGLNKHSTVIRCSLTVVSAAVCNILNLQHKYGKADFLTHIIRTLINTSGTNMKEEVIEKISGFLCCAIDEFSDFSEKC
jgi:succinate dehydrogenase/fumarate reductase-like Fe-S protein